MLADIFDHKRRYRYFQTFITVAAVGKGYSVREIEVLFQPRLMGNSFIRRFPVRIVLGVLPDLGRGFLEYRLGRKPPLHLSPEVLIDRSDPPDRSPSQPWNRRLWFRIYVLLLPIHHWFITKRAATRYRELRRSQWMTRREITELQEIKLRKLVHHAYGHVPYYRELFDERGLRPDDIATSRTYRSCRF